MMQFNRIRRIVDVNLNRACEGLRVLEDIARFFCNDIELTGKIKENRHALRRLFASEITGSTRARDIGSDVGRAPSVMEEDREDMLALVARNAKRVQEALRSLEEISKLGERQRARRIKEMRFSIYGVEQALQEILSQGKGLKGRGVYVVLPDTTERKIMRLVRQLTGAPIAAIQLRCKQFSDGRLLALAKRIRTVTGKYSIPFIVNDRIDIALAAGADGVHLGQNDMPLSEVRKITDFSFTVGVSTHSISEALRAESEGADYVAFGSIFPTKSKEHAVIQGTVKLNRLTKRIAIPVVAIGGISDKNAMKVASAGAQFAAVLSYLSEAPDPAKAAQRLDRVFKTGLTKKSNRG
jgi:thiamine-phosphate pyrophosphorylase